MYIIIIIIVYSHRYLVISHISVVESIGSVILICSVYH